MKKWLTLISLGVALVGCQQTATSTQPTPEGSTTDRSEGSKHLKKVSDKVAPVNQNQQQIDLEKAKYDSQCNQANKAIFLGNSQLADQTGLSIFFGQLPHPGYGFKLVDARYTNQDLTEIKVIIEKILPKPDMMYPQVIVTPCVFLPVKNAAKIKKVDVYLDGNFSQSWLTWPDDGIGTPPVPSRPEYM